MALPDFIKTSKTFCSKRFSDSCLIWKFEDNMFDVFTKSEIAIWIIFSLTAVAVSQYQIPDSLKNSPKFSWPEGKQCTITLTFDDARLSQIDFGIPLLDKYAVKATFYISPDDFVKRAEGWKRAAQNGHEIGNHTMSHPCTGNYAFSRENALEGYTLQNWIKPVNLFIRLLESCPGRLLIPAVRPLSVEVHKP
jgi:hypothetical protein